MRNTDLSKIIEDFHHLPLDDKEYVLDIIKKQLIDSKRDAIVKRAMEASSNYKKGKVKKGTLKYLREDIESD